MIIIVVTFVPTSPRTNQPGNLFSTLNPIPSRSFVGTVSDIVDDAPVSELVYEFGKVKVSASGSQSLVPFIRDVPPTYTFSSLALGNTTVYVCAVDTMGAEYCEYTVSKAGIKAESLRQGLKA